MPADPRLAALPALRKRAEEEAKALSEVCADTFALHMGADMPAMYERGWDGMHEDERDALTAAHLSLLSDLSRPASRDAVARLVAAKARIKIYALHALLAGAIPYPPEWPADLCDRVAAAESEGEALTLIALAVFGGSDGE